MVEGLPVDGEGPRGGLRLLELGPPVPLEVDGVDERDPGEGVDVGGLQQARDLALQGCDSIDTLGTTPNLSLIISGSDFS